MIRNLSPVAEEEIGIIKSLYPESFACTSSGFEFRFSPDFSIDFSLPSEYPRFSPPTFTLHIPASYEANDRLALQLLKKFSVQGCLLQWIEFLQQQKQLFDSGCSDISSEGSAEVNSTSEESKLKEDVVFQEVGLTRETENIWLVKVYEDYTPHHRDVALELLFERINCKLPYLTEADRAQLVSVGSRLVEQLGVVFLETGMNLLLHKLLEKQAEGCCNRTQLDRFWLNCVNCFRQELPEAPGVSCKLKQLILKAKAIHRRSETFHAIVVVSEVCVQPLSNFLSIFVPECTSSPLDAELSGNARRSKMVSFRQKKKAAFLVVSKSAVYSLPLTFAEYIFWLDDADENVFASFPPEVKLFVFSSNPLDLQNYVHAENGSADLPAISTSGRLGAAEDLNLEGTGDLDESSHCENFKSSLQRLMLSRLPGTHPSELIKYNTLEFKHCTHRPLNPAGSRQLFVSNVTLPSSGVSFSGEAHPTKKQAEQSAASAALAYLRNGTEQPPHDFKGELNRLASQHFRTLLNIIRYETYTLPTRTPLFQSTVTIIPFDMAIQGDVQETKKKSQQSAAKKVVESWKAILQSAAAAATKQPLMNIASTPAVM